MASVNPHISLEDLLRFADGELSYLKRVRAKHHLAACWECRAKLQQAESTIGEVMELHHRTMDPQLPPVAGARALLKARLLDDVRSGTPQRTLWMSTWTHAALGGALFALAIVGLWLGQSHMGPKMQDPRLPVLASYAEPDPRLTPGAARLVSTEELCSAELSDDTSGVSSDTRQKVLREYGLTGREPGNYELDYLISPQLGGTEDASNLWPEPSVSTEWNLRAKDALEERLHGLVCRGSISLATAQRDLATDWISAYKKYFHTSRPVEPL
jgi:hypothetical protein